MQNNSNLHHLLIEELQRSNKDYFVKSVSFHNCHLNRDKMNACCISIIKYSEENTAS